MMNRYTKPNGGGGGKPNNSCDEDIRIEKNLNGTETYVFDPYNPTNVLITREDVQNILKTYGITAEITNFELYKRAFVHKSYPPPDG
jgi:hypothetical protein